MHQTPTQQLAARTGFCEAEQQGTQKMLERTHFLIMAYLFFQEDECNFCIQANRQYLLSGP